MEVTSKMLIYFSAAEIEREVREIEKGCRNKPVKYIAIIFQPLKGQRG